MQHPLDVTFTSFLLFICGLLCAVFAGYKGYTASDPYPGYEAVHRRHADACDDIDYLVTTLHGGLDTVRQREIVYTADKPIATRAAIEEIRKAFAALLTEEKRARALDAADSKATANAIRRFRDLNIAIRTDGIVPAYFSIAPDFSHLISPAPSLLDLAAEIDAATERHIKHVEAFNKLIAVQLRKIEIAKDKTESMMRAVAASFLDDTAIPSLAQFRELFETYLTPSGRGS